MQPGFSKSHPFSSLLDEEAMTFVASMMQVEVYPKNHVLIDIHSPVKDIFFVEKGVMKLFYLNKEGEEMNTHFVWDGMLITSFYSLLKRQASDECLVTLTPCQAFRIPYAQLAGNFARFPSIERMARIATEEAFVCYAERSRILQNLTAKDRYNQFLKNTPFEVLQKIPLQDIASYLGIAPGSLSRIRNEFLHKC